MKYLLMLLFVVSVGCAKVTYKDGELSYFRWGSQKIEGLDVSVDPVTKALNVKLGKQEGSAGDLAKTLLNLSEVAKTAVTP